ncbi:MAG: uL15 family ribosomal protein [Planctomycetes bacterium]|nr:uL15 family ribosomal protein [Planctomycetota bacterium]
MQLHELKPNTKLRASKRIGRGGKRGKTSGRGMKGQRARAGHRIRPEIRDLIKKLPKLRGHGKNRARTVNDSTRKALVVNLVQLEEYFVAGENITPTVLKEKGLIHVSKGARKPTIKILGTGSLTKKFTFLDCIVSKTARVKIEKAGGSIVIK